MEHIIYSEFPYVYDDVIIGYPFNLYEAVSVYGREIIPEKPGIYHLFYNELLVYIGMSKDLRGRLTCHLKDDDMPFNNVLWFCDERFYKEDGETNVRKLMEIEYKMIKQLKPSLNTQYLSSQSYGKDNKRQYSDASY